MDARKDYLAPLRVWQESRLHAGPYQVPEYEDFARMVKSMEDMNARIKELEAERDEAEARTDALCAMLKEVVEALTSARDVQRRLQADTYWRTPDNTLWPALTDSTDLLDVTLARIAQEGKE